MSFTRTRLTVGETGRHAAIKNAFHEGFCGVTIHHLVVRILIKGVVETEHLIFQIFCKINFQLRFMNNHVFFRWHSQHNNIAATDFWEKERRFILRNSKKSVGWFQEKKLHLNFTVNWHTFLLKNCLILIKMHYIIKFFYYWKADVHVEDLRRKMNKLISRIISDLTFFIQWPLSDAHAYPVICDRISVCDRTVVKFLLVFSGNRSYQLSC